MAICPRETEDGKLRITLAVSEAKYVEIESLAAKRKESQKQLRDTARPSGRRYFRRSRAARPPIMAGARLADLMLDGIRIPAARGIDLGGWRRAMREGRVRNRTQGRLACLRPDLDRRGRSDRRDRGRRHTQRLSGNYRPQGALSSC